MSSFDYIVDLEFYLLPDNNFNSVILTGYRTEYYLGQKN